MENTSETFTLKIFDALGRELKKEKINSNCKIDIEDLAEGVYFVKVFSEENNMVFQSKLVKEN